MTGIPRSEFDEEHVQLPGRIAEIARDAKSPMRMHELIEELNSRTKLHRTVNTMQKWFSDFQKKIPYLGFDIDTKVKMIFLFRAKVDAKYRKIIQESAASVVFDNEKRIIKYKSKDGSFELNAESSTSTKQRLAKKGSRYSDTSETEEDDDEEDEEEEKIDVEPEVKRRSGRVRKMPQPYTDNRSDLRAKKKTSSKSEAVKTKSRGRPKKSTKRINEKEDEEDGSVQKQNSRKTQKAKKTKKRNVEAQGEFLGEPNPQPVKKARYSSLERTEGAEEDEQTPPVEETPEHQREDPEEQEGIIFDDAAGYDGYDGYDGYREEPARLLEGDLYQRGGEEEVEEPRYVYEYPEEPERHQERNHYDPRVEVGEQDVYYEDPVELQLQEEANLEVQQEEGVVDYEGNIFQETKPSRMYQNFLTMKREFTEEQYVVPNVREMKPNQFRFFGGSSNSNMEYIQPTEYVSTLPHPDPIEETISGRSLLRMVENMVVWLDFPETFKELQSKILEKYGKVDHQIKSDVIYSTMHFGLHAAVNCAKAGQISEESTSLVGYLMTLSKKVDVLNLPKSGEFKEEIKKFSKDSSNQSKVVPTKNICSIFENALMVIPSS